MVPSAGIEPALLSEPDFESGASTNSAKRALAKLCFARCADLYECIGEGQAYFLYETTNFLSWPRLTRKLG